MTDIDCESIQTIAEIYVGECHSISGRSALTYVIGKDQAHGTLHLRIAGNTGNGMWCKDWAPAQAIEAIVEGSQDLRAKSFQKLHPGKSINTGGFVLAALRDLGLVQPGSPNTRLHEHVPEATLERVLMARLKAEEGGGNPARKVRRKAKEAI